MTEMNPLNVFKGKGSVIDYFNPDLQPPLPLVEVPDRLNPLRGDGVRVYAKMLTALPAQNVKALPALNMLLNEPGAAKKSIVEASSGSTALSLGMLSRVLWGNEDVCAHVTNKKHPDSLRLLRFFGLQVSLYGGLAQQEPVDPQGIMNRLRRLAREDENLCYPGQYDNDHNWKSHSRWTGAQIWRQLPEIKVFCTTVGTGGCITGTGVYLKEQTSSVKVVGVCNIWGDPTPGPRHLPGFECSMFPWRSTIDAFETVASVDSYDMSMQLSREGLIAGPSSGEALVGLFAYLQKLKGAGKLHELADPQTGEISCVFTCSDLPYQYIDGYYQKLGEDKFPPIHNKILLTCDLDKYDERWELVPKKSMEMLLGRRRSNCLCRRCSRKSVQGVPGCTRARMCKGTILDLRQSKDFDAEHVLASISSPLKNLTAASGDIFQHPQTIHMHWTNLKAMFGAVADRLGSKSLPLLVICYSGETARLGTSILRAAGYEAFGVKGGYSALKR